MLNAFATCPKAFYDTYILKKIQTDRSSALEFGTALHLGIRDILDGEDGAASFEMYWNSVKDVRMVYYGESWSDLRSVAMDSFLPNFKSRHAKKFTDFEQEVGMEMPFEVHPKGDYYSDHILQGTADYIGRYEGLTTVADWKTSGKNYKPNKILLNPQMYIYAKLYEHKHGKIPEQILYKVFNKKTGTIHTHAKQLTAESLNAIFTQVEHLTKAMLHSIETKELYHGADCYCQGA